MRCLYYLLCDEAFILYYEQWLAFYGVEQEKKNGDLNSVDVVVVVVVTVCVFLLKPNTYIVLWLLSLALAQCRKIILLNQFRMYNTIKHVPLTLTLSNFAETSKRINVVTTDPTHVTITRNCGRRKKPTEIQRCPHVMNTCVYRIELYNYKISHNNRFYPFSISRCLSVSSSLTVVLFDYTENLSRIFLDNCSFYFQQEKQIQYVLLSLRSI